MAIETARREPELEAVLSRYMNACALRGPVYAFKQTGSTMEDAHELAAQGAPEGTLAYAARQTQGRGRLGRAWESPEGGAYFSIILRPKRPPADIPQLSLVAGLAAVEGIRQLVPIYPSIRWPNDVIVNQKKLAGILVESQLRSSTPQTAHSPQMCVVVGVGINVTTKPSDLPETAVALSALVSSCPHPHQATGAVWRRFSTWYERWAKEGFAPIRQALRPWIGHFGQVVRMTTDQRRAERVQRSGQATEVEGQAVDIDEQGRLIVRLDSGFLRAFEMGEVTLLR